MIFSSTCFRPIPALLGALLTLVIAAPAAAQHHGHGGDIEIELEDNRLSVAPGDHGLVFLGEFEPTASPSMFFTEEPGFDAHDGTFSPGTNIDLELLSNLLYFDGAEHAPVPANIALRINRGPVELAELTGNDTLTSFVLGTADAEGGLHQHLEFVLAGPDGPTPVMPAGVFGLHVRLTAPGLEASEAILIALNQGLDDEAFEAGAERLAEIVGVPVPEPASVALLAVGLAMFVVSSRFRRKGLHAAR